MHVVTNTVRRGGREYTSTLLRRSYREGGKVKKETLAPPPGQAAASPPPERQHPSAGEPTPLSPAATPPPPGPTPRFQWPLNGKIITPYGSSNGQKSDGIDIAAANGMPSISAPLKLGTVLKIPAPGAPR